MQAPARELSGPLLLLDLIGRSDLDRGEKNVAQVLVRWAGTKTRRCWPSVLTIAEHAGLSDRGVQRIMRRLQAKGVVVMETQTHGGRGQSNTMRLDAAALRKRCEPGREMAAAEKPRPAIPETPTGDPVNPDPGSGEKTKKRSMKRRPPARGGGPPCGTDRRRGWDYPMEGAH